MKIKWKNILIFLTFICILVVIAMIIFNKPFASLWMQTPPPPKCCPRSGLSLTSVVMPDASIVVIGGLGSNLSDYKKDVWRSTDDGVTWKIMTEDTKWPSQYSTSAVISDGSIISTGGMISDCEFIYCIQNNAVWRSTDKGATWTEMTPHAGWSARVGQNVVAMPDGSIVLMGGGDFWRSYTILKGKTITNITGKEYNDVWLSADKGLTWSLVTAHAGWSARHGSTAVAMPDGSIVLMGGDNGSIVPMGGHSITDGLKNDTWRSTNKGATWNLMTPHAEWSARSSPEAVVLPDGSIVLMGGSARDSFRSKFVSLNDLWPSDVWRSTDYGATWKLMNSSAGWSGIYYNSVAMPDGSIIRLAYNDTWRSRDKGATWSRVISRTM